MIQKKYENSESEAGLPNLMESQNVFYVILCWQSGPLFDFLHLTANVKGWSMGLTMSRGNCRPRPSVWEIFQSLGAMGTPGGAGWGSANRASGEPSWNRWH